MRWLRIWSTPRSGHVCSQAADVEQRNSNKTSARFYFYARLGSFGFGCKRQGCYGSRTGSSARLAFALKKFRRKVKLMRKRVKATAGRFEAIGSDARPAQGPRHSRQILPQSWAYRALSAASGSPGNARPTRCRLQQFFKGMGIDLQAVQLPGAARCTLVEICQAIPSAYAAPFRAIARPIRGVVGDSLEQWPANIKPSAAPLLGSARPI